MPPRLKAVILDVLPPVVVRMIGYARAYGRKPVSTEPTLASIDAMVGSTALVVPPAHPQPEAPREPPEWEMVPDNDATWTSAAGWSHDSIARLQQSKWGAFLDAVRKPNAPGKSHEASADAPADIATHNTIMTFAYVLGRAALGRTHVRVLDWGGGLGHYCVYAQELFPELSIDYVVKDLPQLCAIGRDLLPAATFIDNASEALARQYDLVFASSSLHYARDPYGLLGRLCDCAETWVMVTRTPIVESHDDFVVVQRPHAYGYMTEYPGWFMSRRRLLDFMNTRRFSLERQFLVAEQPHVPNAPEQAQYFGFLFRRVTMPARS